MSMIWNKPLIKSFYETLPALQEDEVYIVSALADKRYYDQLPANIKILDTVSIKSNKEEFLRKVELLGKKKYGSIPKSAMKLVISVNPKSVMKGTANFVKEFLDMLLKDEVTKSINAKVMKSIRETNSRNIYKVVITERDSELDRYSKDNWIAEMRIVCGNEVYLVVTSLNELRDFDFRVQKFDEVPIPGTLMFGEKVYLGWNK
ncbi:hypothetical protein J7L13_00135 [bacterium]|nr:hypothetical protein [bacterium]